MKKQDMRIRRILEILSEREKAEVSLLSDALGVSQVTVRKDLDTMEELGLVQRVHGYAELGSPNDPEGRLACHYNEKRKIAEKAAELVAEDSTVIIENGSCCALLADVLAQTRKNITMITNSAFIASYVRKKASFRIVLLGGNYQKDSQVNVGPMIAQGASGFLVEKMFIGVDGYSAESGFSNRDQLRAQAVRDMAAQADEVIVLTESEKFSRRGTVPLGIGEKISAVITDSGIPEEILSLLAEKGVCTVMV